jgi:hypothetical protein
MKSLLLAAMLCLLVSMPVQVHAAKLTNEQKDSIMALLTEYKADQSLINKVAKALGIEKPKKSSSNLSDTPTFKVKDIKAKSVTSTTTQVMGEYTLTLEVTAGKKVVSIPKTTTDSTKGVTGIMYSPEGQDFRGIQRSIFDCKSSQGHCKIEPGKKSTIKVTVLLGPKESGNYGVSFGTLHYRLGGIAGPLLKWKINTESEVIYVNGFD